MCVYMFVCTWLGMTPCWGKNVSECVQMPDCVSAIWQASLLEKSLSDCRSIWQAPILRKAYGLGRADKYTRRKSPLLTPGQQMLRSQGCIEYRSKHLWCGISTLCENSQLSGKHVWMIDTDPSGFFLNLLLERYHLELYLVYLWHQSVTSTFNAKK